MTALRPVFLVHGFKDTGSKMRRLADFLRRQGRPAHAVTLQPSWGEVGIDTLAEKLKATIEAETGPDGPIDLIGFSMGGLISRYYVQQLGGVERVKCLFTIATPHRGTWNAHWLSRPACLQMRPGSAFLRDLNADLSALERVSFLSLWTPLDLMIVPAHSSRMAVGGESIHWVVAHPLMVWQRSVWRKIEAALSASS